MYLDLDRKYRHQMIRLLDGRVKQVERFILADATATVEHDGDTHHFCVYRPQQHLPSALVRSIGQSLNWYILDPKDHHRMWVGETAVMDDGRHVNRWTWHEGEGIDLNSL